MTASDFAHKVRVLHLVETQDGYHWETLRETYAAVDRSAKSVRRSRFAVAGQMADQATLILRAQALTRSNLLQIGEAHALPVQIYAHQRRYLKAECALVKIVSCALLDEDERAQYTFPAAITEKYVRWEQEMPMDINQSRYVIVVPKAINLTAGELVRVEDAHVGGVYAIRTAHELDAQQNEYELGTSLEL